MTCILQSLTFLLQRFTKFHEVLGRIFTKFRTQMYEENFAVLRTLYFVICRTAKLCSFKTSLETFRIQRAMAKHTKYYKDPKLVTIMKQIRLCLPQYIPTHFTVILDTYLATNFGRISRFWGLFGQISRHLGHFINFHPT